MGVVEASKSRYHCLTSLAKDYKLVDYVHICFFWCVVVDFEKSCVLLMKSIFLPKFKLLDFKDATTLVWFVLATPCLFSRG
jgi:hypothetical protein